MDGFCLLCGKTCAALYCQECVLRAAQLATSSGSATVSAASSSSSSSSAYSLGATSSAPFSFSGMPPAPGATESTSTHSRLASASIAEDATASPSYRPIRRHKLPVQLRMAMKRLADRERRERRRGSQATSGSPSATEMRDDPIASERSSQDLSRLTSRRVRGHPTTIHYTSASSSRGNHAAAAASSSSSSSASSAVPYSVAVDSAAAAVAASSSLGTQKRCPLINVSGLEETTRKQISLLRRLKAQFPLMNCTCSETMFLGQCYPTEAQARAVATVATSSSSMECRGNLIFQMPGSHRYGVISITSSSVGGQSATAPWSSAYSFSATSSSTVAAAASSSSSATAAPFLSTATTASSSATTTSGSGAPSHTPRKFFELQAAAGEANESIEIEHFPRLYIANCCEACARWAGQKRNSWKGAVKSEREELLKFILPGEGVTFSGLVRDRFLFDQALDTARRAVERQLREALADRGGLFVVNPASVQTTTPGNALDPAQRGWTLHHAEMEGLVYAFRHGYSIIAIYLDRPPCSVCARTLSALGVERDAVFIGGEAGGWIE